MRCKRCFGPIEDANSDAGLYDDALYPDEEYDGTTTAASTDDEDDVTPTQTVLFCDQCVVERNANPPPLDVESLFAPDGPLARPGFEVRPGQVRLARAIYEAAAHHHHVFAEGPTGIGKSKAYGVPAAYLASHRKKIVIVTASIALQEQLIQKDLPALQKELAGTFAPWTFAILKGKSNYACLEQMPLADDEGLGQDDRTAFRTVSAWAKDTKVGDKSELLIKPSELVWGRFSTSSEACPGSKCASYKKCFATLARNKAAAADIIVTNYHMFFLNMAYGGTLLPEADVVIMDEGHEATDIARDLLGFRISYHTFARYIRDAKKRGATAEAMIMDQAATSVFSTLLRFYDSGHYATMLRFPAPPMGADELVAAVKAYAAACPKSHFIGHAQAAAERLRDGLAIKDENCVYSIDVKESQRVDQRTNQRYRSAALQCRYVQPGPVLAEKLWAAYQSVIAVSATITVGNKFDFARRELGAPVDTHELSVETPFNFAEQAMIITSNPLTTPETNHPGFPDTVARTLLEVIEACRGRTLGLFTSYKALNHAYDAILRATSKWPADVRPRILRQGDAPPGQLADAFKRDVNSVLLGTSSFWTGIDVPGEALTGLVIDKLPFGSPDDPVTTRISENDRNAFQNFMVPKAILMFRQGVGRLIRSQADVGVVVIVDKRVSTKGYGKQFLKSLPVMVPGVGTQSIAGFLERAANPQNTASKKGQAA